MKPLSIIKNNDNSNWWDFDNFDINASLSSTINHWFAERILYKFVMKNHWGHYEKIKNSIAELLKERIK